MRRYRQLILMIFIFLLLIAKPSQCQILIIDPPNVTFRSIESGLFYESEIPARLKIVTSENWAVSCIAEPLINETNGVQINLEKLFIKHDLTSEYQPMNTSIDLGTGQSTGGSELLVNSLYFKIELNGDEPAGIYHGIVRFFSGQNSVLQLQLILKIKKQFQMNVSSQSVNFRTSAPGLYSADKSIVLSVASNLTNWHIEAAMISSNSTVNQIFINSKIQDDESDEGAGEGFRKLENHPVVMTGSQCDYNCSTFLEFKLLTEWITSAGEYQVAIELNVPEAGFSKQIYVNIEVSKYSVFSLSASDVYFHANGPPAIWDGDKTIKLLVGTNSSFWNVICEATDLINQNDVIPNERIYLKIDPDEFTQNQGAGAGYRKMNIPIEVATGAQTPPHHVCEMKFKLKTLETDRPGHYEGTVTFTHLTNP